MDQNTFWVFFTSKARRFKAEVQNLRGPWNHEKPAAPLSVSVELTHMWSWRRAKSHAVGFSDVFFIVMDSSWTRHWRPLSALDALDVLSSLCCISSYSTPQCASLATCKQRKPLHWKPCKQCWILMSVMLYLNERSMLCAHFSVHLRCRGSIATAIAGQAGFFLLWRLGEKSHRAAGVMFSDTTQDACCADSLALCWSTPFLCASPSGPEGRSLEGVRRACEPRGTGSTRSHRSVQASCEWSKAFDSWTINDTETCASPNTSLFQDFKQSGPRTVRFNVSFWTLTRLIPQLSPGSQSVHVRQLLRKVVSAVVEDQAFVHFEHWYASSKQTSLTAFVLSASFFCSNWEFKTLPFPFLCKMGFFTLATEALLEASFALLRSVTYCQGFTENLPYHSS